MANDFGNFGDDLTGELNDGVNEDIKAILSRMSELCKELYPDKDSTFYFDQVSSEIKNDSLNEEEINHIDSLL